MGNGASSQGSIPSHGRRDVGTSIVKEQQYWQEQAVALRQETLSLPDGRKPYSGAQRGARKSANAIEDNAEPSPPTEKGDGNLEADSSESRARDDVIIIEEQGDEKQDSDADVASTPDVGSDQPASIEEMRSEGAQPTTSSLQEVLGSTNGFGSKRHAVGSGIATSASTSDREEPTIREGEMQFGDIPESDISMDEDWPTLSPATIDCPTSSEPAPIDRVPQASPNDRQRPARTAKRPPRYRDDSFETHFQPLPRRHYRKIQTQNSTESSNVNAEVHHDLGRGDNNKRQKRQKQTFRLGTSCHSRSVVSFHPETSSTHQKRSRTAHLQFKSRASTDRRTAVPRSSKAAEIVINVPPAARALSADTRSITTATIRGRRAAVSSNKNAESVSAFVDRRMQNTDNSSSEKPVHSESCQPHLQRQKPQINATVVQTPLKSAISANECRVIDNPFTEKIKIAETTAFTEICKNKAHKHRFRRKKRQKSRRNSQGE